MSNRNRYTRNYIHRQSKKEDKYEGLFSGKQLADLDGGINDIPIEKVTKEELVRRQKEQKIRGIGINMHTPF